MPSPDPRIEPGLLHCRQILYQLSYQGSPNLTGSGGLPAMWETWAESLGREDPLDKEMATHSTVLAWKIAWLEEPGRL